MVEKLRIGVAVKHGIDCALARADRSTGLVNLATAPRKTSDFDMNAVEEAVRIREKQGGTVTAISVGGPSSREALRDAVAVGADTPVLITADNWAEWDTRAVAHLLAAGIRSLGGFDLILLGEGSTDHFAGVLGPRLAAELGIPNVAYARKLTVAPDGITAEKDLEKEVETVTSGYPVVVTVGQEINTVRVPSFMANLKATKKEVKVLAAKDLGLAPELLSPGIVIDRTAVPETPRKQTKLTGASPAEIAGKLAEALRGEGVLA